MITVNVINNNTIDIGVKLNNVSVSIVGGTSVIAEKPYTGTYHVVPSNEPVTLFTKDRSMLENVIVDPIPKNYGLITYNGFSITVS